MAGKYEGLAKIIVQNVGGRTNIKSVSASGNTLSFELGDFGRANTDILKGTDGISGVDNSGEHYEVSVKKNTGEVYAAVCERAGLSTEGYVVDESSGIGIGTQRLILFLVAFAVSFGVIVAVNMLALGGVLGVAIEVVFAAAAAAIGVVVGMFVSGHGSGSVSSGQLEGGNAALGKPDAERIGSPVEGTANKLSNIEDKAFATGALGKGIWFEPSVGRLYAPCDGVLTTFFPTGHAVGVRSDSGADILIHVGMNTVALDGRGFTPKRKQGDYVKRGELLLEFDINAIREAGYLVSTPMVVSNTEDYSEVAVLKTGAVKPGENVLSLK